MGSLLGLAKGCAEGLGYVAGDGVGACWKCVSCLLRLKFTYASFISLYASLISLSLKMVMGKGGIRQKLGLAKRKAAKATPVRSDPMGRQLAKMYGEGKISAAEVGQTAAIASCTGASSSSQVALTRLAKAAPKRMTTTKSGKQAPVTKNASRALKRVLGKDSTLPPSYVADVWMWDTAANANTKYRQDGLFAHS